jgi:hypothetical protein
MHLTEGWLMFVGEFAVLGALAFTFSQVEGLVGAKLAARNTA